MTTRVAAKRGDLVLIEEKTDYGDRQPCFVLERVTSVTRDGWPRVTAKYIFGHESEEPLFRNVTSRGSTYRRHRVHYVGHLLIEASKVDVQACWAAWLARYDDWRVPPFRSVDEARAFVAPFKHAEVN